jgi:hypothetical protein
MVDSCHSTRSYSQQDPSYQRVCHNIVFSRSKGIEVNVWCERKYVIKGSESTLTKTGLDITPPIAVHARLLMLVWLWGLLVSLSPFLPSFSYPGLILGLLIGPLQHHKSHSFSVLVLLLCSTTVSEMP